MRKIDFVRSAWKVYCQIYNIPHDQADVYSKGGKWFGQCRKVEQNGYDTTLISEWRIHFNDADFSANKIK